MENEKGSRTVLFGHLRKTLPNGYAAREIQDVPNQRQPLWPWGVWELELASGIPGPEVPCERDEGNCSPDGDNQVGEYLWVAEHDCRPEEATNGQGPCLYRAFGRNEQRNKELVIEFVKPEAAPVLPDEENALLRPH